MTAVALAGFRFVNCRVRAAGRLAFVTSPTAIDAGGNAVLGHYGPVQSSNSRAQPGPGSLSPGVIMPASGVGAAA
ncbi:MAG: hypothetical protein IPG61_17535 [bacterium]|nr:hypothetical protein [bacterium]